MSADRRGRRVAEYLCERCLYTYIDYDGTQKGAVVLLQPRSLSAGTTALHCYACAEAAFETLKQKGFTGISIAHYCIDRANMSAMMDLLEARHAKWAAEHLRLGGPVQQRLMDWVTCTGCAMHDASKALQWALDPWVTEKQMLKDLHIVIESCRQAYDLLEEYMPAFLIKHMERVDTPYSKAEVAHWWRCLGAGADWIDSLVDVNPFFLQGKLRVSMMADGKVLLASTVANCLFYVFKLKTFSETRWCGVGQSCRGLVASLSVGLYPLALLALELKGSVDTKLHGVKKLNGDIRWYAAVASITTFVPETFCVAIAEDDRVCRRLPELDRLVLEEQEFIFSISPFVWKQLAYVAGGILKARELRTACCDAAHTAAAFLAHRVFSVARSPPWSLTFDDVDANFRALQEGDGSVVDEVTKTIIRLLEVGFSMFE